MDSKRNFRVVYAPPRPAWHKFASRVCATVAMLSLVVLLGLAQPDPSVPALVVLAYVMVSIALAAFGLAGYRHFGGKLPWNSLEE